MDLILFYWEFYKSQNFREYRRFNAQFFCLFNQPPLHFVSQMSPICVRSYFCFTRTYVYFHITENCVNNTVAASFHSSQNFNFPFSFPLENKYFAWPQSKNSKWGLVKGKASLGVLRYKTSDIQHSYKYRLTCRLILRARFKVNIFEYASLSLFHL